MGENHVAVLLEDGRICRIGYSEDSPPISAPSTAMAKDPLTTPVTKEKR